MNVLIAGGGTGGHVFPAIAIAEAFVLRDPQTRVMFAGRSDSIEARLVAQRGWPFHAISAAPLKGVSWVRRVRGVWIVALSCLQAWQLLRRLRPDCVVGTGGYVSGPMLLMAALRGIPTVIEEQNSVPGVTNRWLGRIAKKICTTFAESRRYFPARKIVETGLPVRQALVAAVRDATRRTGDVPVLLVMGGSGGARRLNELMIDVAPHLAVGVPQCRVIHQVGRQGDASAIAQSYRTAGVAADVLPFIERMEEIYPTVDLAISRAGAGSVVELSLFGVPTIFIPFPHATDNHQEMNARELVACGGAVLLREQDASPERLAEVCVRLLRDRPQLAAMSAHMRQISRPDAAARVVDVCLQVAA